MPKHIASISIVTYNSEEYIGKLLDTLHTHLPDTYLPIYVVDNASTDNTLKILESKKYNIKVISNAHNLGFGAGHNIAINLIDSKYHFLINPDIVISSDVISKMIEYLDKNEDVGIVVPKVLNPDGKVQILPKRDPKIISLISRRINIKPLRKYREEYEMLEFDENSTFDIEFASGCFMGIRTDLLKKAGGFDERYFLYFEDADLSRRIREHSCVRYNPKLTVYHCWQRAGARSLRYFIIQIISMLKYLLKWKKSKI